MKIRDVRKGKLKTLRQLAQLLTGFAALTAYRTRLSVVQRWLRGPQISYLRFFEPIRIGGKNSDFWNLHGAVDSCGVADDAYAPYGNSRSYTAGFVSSNFSSQLLRAFTYWQKEI